LPIELTNAEIRNSDAYKEYYVVATRATPPKTKASARKTKSSSDTIITPPPPTAAADTRLFTSAKGKQPATTSKAKNEGTGTIPGVLDVPTKESDEEISWKSSDEGDDDDDEEGNDDDDDAQDDDDDQEDENKDDDDQEERDDEDDQEEGKDDEKASDEEGNGEENLGLNVGREEGQDEEDDADELYRDVNINLEGRGVQMGDAHTTQEFEDSYVTLTLSDRLRDEAQAENEEFLKTINENMQKIIKEQVKEQVKVQVSKMLPKIEQTVNEQLEAEVLTRSSNSLKTSYVVAADLSKMELKKILIEKMEGKKSIHRSNEQRNLYKAFVEAYESYKIILNTYGDTVTLKRHRDDDANKDEEPSVGSDRGSKRRREGKEPYESATLEEPMQTTLEMEEPSHPEFKTGADDQPMAEPSQHPEWFSQQKKPPTPYRDWNKTFAATHRSIQPWISELEKQIDSRSSINKLMDTLVGFLAFLMNRLK
nr:hypothetical protein [Tanacetum cinerariifolium]